MFKFPDVIDHALIGMIVKEQVLWFKQDMLVDNVVIQIVQDDTPEIRKLSVKSVL